MTRHPTSNPASTVVPLRKGPPNEAERKVAQREKQSVAEAGAEKRQEEDRNEEDAVKDIEEDAEDARQDAEDAKSDLGG